MSLYSVQQEHQIEEELAFFIDKLREYDTWSKEQNISPFENLLERANRISRLRNFKVSCQLLNSHLCRITDQII